MRGRGIPGPAALAAVLAAGAVLAALAAERARAPEARAARGAPPLGILNVLALDLLWLRADALFAENRWPEMLAAYEAAGRAEPRLSASWEYRGFHLAYNLAGNAADEADRDRWVLEGVRVLDEGLRRNPASRSLRAYLGHVLFARSERWPSLRPRLAKERGRDPREEAADLLGAVVAEEPENGAWVFWYADVLLARGRGALEAAPPEAPCPAAAGDFRLADAALGRLALSLGPEGREMIRTLRLGIEDLVRVSGAVPAAERKAVLDRTE